MITAFLSFLLFAQMGGTVEYHQHGRVWCDDGVLKNGRCVPAGPNVLLNPRRRRHLHLRADPNVFTWSVGDSAIPVLPVIYKQCSGNQHCPLKGENLPPVYAVPVFMGGESVILCIAGECRDALPRVVPAALK
jgi:hypothetical protein